MKSNKLIRIPTLVVLFSVITLANAGAVNVSVVIPAWSASLSGMQFDLEVRGVGSHSLYNTNTSITLSGSGTATLSDPGIPTTGNVDISIKRVGCLRQTLYNVPVTSLASFNLLSGDIDDDNEVSLGDYARMSAAMLTNSSSPFWDPDCDLDGDGWVDAADLSIFSAYFGFVGDD